MPSRSSTLLLAAATALVSSTSGYAVTYLNVNQAQAALFPGIQLAPATYSLSPAFRSQIEHSVGQRFLNQPKAWRGPRGEWFLVDEVYGKHDYITYAVGISPDGSVRGVEIMDYRETFGGEVRNPKWLARFAGLNVDHPPVLEKGIPVIGGATLSCRHITDGVHRLLELHALVLSKL